MIYARNRQETYTCDAGFVRQSPEFAKEYAASQREPGVGKRLVNVSVMERKQVFGSTK